MTRSLVTGGAGVIGRALVEQLSVTGHAVRVVDIQPRPGWMPADVSYVQADLQDLDPSALSAFAPQTLFHLAATFERSEEAPDFWRANAGHNVKVSSNVLEAALQTPSLRRYIFASSYLVYDPKNYLTAGLPVGPVPLAETSAIRPRNVCGAAKLLHEMELELATRASTELSWAAARIFRVYGRGSRDVVSRWVRAALAGQTIETFGEESLFDYVYADDVAVGLIRLAESSFVGPVNLGSGSARSVGDVVRSLGTHFPHLAIKASAAPSEYEASQAEMQRFQSEVGQPPDTSVEAGIGRLVEYEQNEGATPAGRRRTAAPRHANVLITSASRKVPLLLAMRRAMLAMSTIGLLWAADSGEKAAAALEADRWWRMPPLADVSDDEIVAFCQDQAIRLILPTRDGELARMAAISPRLSAVGTHVAVSSSATIEVCDDKLAFFEACIEAGAPAIRTLTEPLDALADRWAVKERRGAGARNMGRRLDHEAARRHGALLDDPVYQPWTEGTELSIDVFVDQGGRCLGAIARSRDLIVGGESQVTTVVSSPELRASSARLAETLGVRGHAVFQAIVDGSGHAQFLECNARVGGASNLAFAAGLNSPMFLLQEALGEPPGPGLTDPLRSALFRAPSDRIVFE